jgi:transposase
MHTLFDLKATIPSFMLISKGNMHDVNALDYLLVEAGAFYILDRGYIDFERLYSLHQQQAYFVIRAKSNLDFHRLYSHNVDRSTGLRCDQTVLLAGINTAKDYPDKLRRIKYVDEQKDRTLVFLTNNFHITSFSVAQLYKSRWQIELFFKWIKQHLRIKAFYGTSDNAVKT